MDEQSEPDQGGRLRRTARTAGGGLACLGLLVMLAIVAFIVLVYASIDPGLTIAVVAFFMAAAALKSSKSRR